MRGERSSDRVRRGEYGGERLERDGRDDGSRRAGRREERRREGRG